MDEFEDIPKHTSIGTIPFGPYKTFYKLFGNINDMRNLEPPVVVLHGGPGTGHEPGLPFADLAFKPNHKRAVLFYDQIGSARSTLLPEKKGDTEFWTVKLFTDQLESFLRHFGLGGQGGREYDLIGQSWGGTLAGSFASLTSSTLSPNPNSNSPPSKGLRKLVLLGSPVDFKLHESELLKLKDGLGKETAAIIDREEAAGRFGSRAYEDACGIFLTKHVLRGDSTDYAMEGMINLKTDTTAYDTMNGPSEIRILGTLSKLSLTPSLPQIKVPVFLIRGEHDQATKVSLSPWLEHLGSKDTDNGGGGLRFWEVEGGSHMVHIEKREEVIKEVDEWLASK